MTLNLLPLPYTIARNIIEWCWEHDIDKAKCYEIVKAMSTKGYDLPEAQWTLEIPEKYVSWFVLKWGFNVTEADQ